MSQYNKILQSFKNLGYSQTANLQEYQINKALDRITASSGGPGQFDRDVAQQLWDHTPKDKGNTVLLRDYVQSIIEAQNVLKQHIQATQQKLKYQTNPQDKQQIQADLLSYVNDHKILSQPFNLPHVPDSRAISQSKANLAASNRVSAYHGSGGNDAGWARTSQIFAMVPSQRQESWSLKIVFILTAVLIGVELFIMFHKNHFFNLMAYVLIMLIFVQNFFDKLYMRITIVWVVLSVLLDFLWLIVHSQNWWNPYAPTQHSTLQTGYLRFSYFLVICTMLAKVLLTILMIRYFNNSDTIRKSVTLFSLSFKLDGRSNNNPITQAITGGRQPDGDRLNFA